MKRLKLLAIFAAFAAAMSSCGSRYSYESVDGDPLKTRIYTLDNGLKVYMNVNRETPRIQTYIAVRVGGKNDPAETTGLAHYFEHLMFKGTQQFGTQDYEAEKPLLDEIERQFEIYRTKTDPAERKAIYAVIDSLSYEASKLAIPNEYDKLMAVIGADGTNAYTSYDETVYVEDIPSNQIENWARIQADRFANCVIRGFHTELETVYEEYNMSLTSDQEKVFDNTLAMLFPNHPYGRQTILGSQDDLKNPSITNIKRYHDVYYVPNNMAVCMSGDFDPDKTIEIIDRYFGSLEPNPELPGLKYEPEAPVTSPLVREVYGQEAEMISMAWRAGGAASDDADMLSLVSSILSNGKAGLLDLDLVQQQKVLYAGGFDFTLTDYGMLMTMAMPKEGQSLEELRDLLLAEMEKLRRGEFDESLLEAVQANYKASIMERMDDNAGRADAYVRSFVNGTSWADEVARLDKMGSITKADVVAWANENIKADNYALVFKRQGRDESQKKIDKPAISPIETNRDVQSAFLTEITSAEVPAIEPVFVDYARDMSVTAAGRGQEVLYKKNETNDLFSLTYIYDTNDPELRMAFDYLSYLGTADKSAEEINTEFYRQACSWSASTRGDRFYVTVSGLGENMNDAMSLFEELMAGAQPDEAVLANLKNDMFKVRKDNKTNQRACFNALRAYGTYGPQSPQTNVMSDERIASVTSGELLEIVRSLKGWQHGVLYYGAADAADVVAAIDDIHTAADSLVPAPGAKKFVMSATPNDEVLMAEYDAKQIYFIQISNRGEKFDTANDAAMEMYNTYFGGGMNSIVFQEMREARGLAYSASAWLGEGRTSGEPYVYTAFIATQNDKMGQAIDAFEEIIENMPESEAAFNIAKESILASLATQRTVKSDVLWSYIAARDKGVDYDRNKAVYEQVQRMTLDDVKAFQQKWVKDRNYRYCILGDSKDLDMARLRAIGPVRMLSQKEIFGY